MDILMALIMIIAGFFFLVKGADLFVDSASGIAGKLGISPVVIGLTIVAFGTSMPELAVSVTAALEGANEIALGNVVGSNIFNLLVVAGGSACLYPLACDRILLKRDWPLSALAALVLGIFLFGDQRISRGEALILLAMFGAVLFMQLKGAKQTEEKAPETRPMGRLLLFLVIGIAAIVIGGQITVDGATSLARILGLSETLIGLTIVAVGTSLPSWSLRSLRRAKARTRSRWAMSSGRTYSISCASSAYRRCSIRSRWRSRRFMTQRFFWL